MKRKQINVPANLVNRLKSMAAAKEEFVQDIVTRELERVVTIYEAKAGKKK